MLISTSIRLRLTLWYVLLLAVILGIFIAGVYLVLRHTLYNNLDDSIQNQATLLFDRAILNLLDNATKYTPAGGEVSVCWNVTGDRTGLWVRDSGKGIPEEHIPLIFDRFYRVDQARGRSEGGVGLGLAISRWIAEAHGGSIQCRKCARKWFDFHSAASNSALSQSYRRLHRSFIWIGCRWRVELSK